MHECSPNKDVCMQLDSGRMYMETYMVYTHIIYQNLSKELMFRLKFACIFPNYFSNRQQMVKLENGIMSKPLEIRMGVPQGSILGPFLFLIYIYDVMYSLRQCDSQITLYADETILYRADIDIYRACANNRETLTRLCEWCNLNWLTINVGKTKHIIWLYKRMV